MSSAEEAPSLIGYIGKKLCRKILVRFVNFAGAKAKNSISRANVVSHRNAPLKDAASRPVSMGVRVAAAVVAAVAAQVNQIICASYVPNSVPAACMVFWNASSVVIMRLQIAAVG